MKTGKKIRLLLCFFVILVMSYLLIELISFSSIGVSIKPSHYILDTVVLVYWIYLLIDTLKNKDDKSETISK